MMGELNMRRALLIARRDYLGYIKTWGFWISFFLPFVFGILGAFATQLDINIEPTRYETIIDETGQHEAGLLAQYDRSYTARVRAQLLPMATLMLADTDVTQINTLLDSGDVSGVISYMNSKSPGLGESMKLPKRKTVFVAAPSGLSLIHI